MLHALRFIAAHRGLTLKMHSLHSFLTVMMNVPEKSRTDDSSKDAEQNATQYSKVCTIVNCRLYTLDCTKCIKMEGKVREREKALTLA